MIYGFLGVAAIALAAAHEGMGGLVVHDAMTNPSLEYDKTRWGDATWKEEELRHALVMSYHVGGLYAATLGMMFVLAEFQPPSSRRLLATIASLMSFGMVAAASIVDGDLSMAFSTAPPVVVWTVIGTIGAATVALSKDPSGGRSKAD